MGVKVVFFVAVLSIDARRMELSELVGPRPRLMPHGGHLPAGMADLDEFLPLRVANARAGARLVIPLPYLMHRSLLALLTIVSEVFQCVRVFRPSTFPKASAAPLCHLHIDYFFLFIISELDHDASFCPFGCLGLHDAKCVHVWEAGSLSRLETCPGPLRYAHNSILCFLCFFLCFSYSIH